MAGDQAELAFTMPLELRVGARDSASKTWGVNADFVYQGWNSLDAAAKSVAALTVVDTLRG